MVVLAQSHSVILPLYVTLEKYIISPQTRLTMENVKAILHYAFGLLFGKVCD